MKKKKVDNQKDVLEFQPDAVEIEERPVPGAIRWVLYVILFSLVAVVVGAVIFKVDRIVVTEGSLITTSPTITVQPLNTAAVRSIEVRVGDLVEKGQILATLDSTFASADLSQLEKRRLTLDTQVRRIRAELEHNSFKAKPAEGDDGRLQEQLFQQREVIFDRNKQLNNEKVAGLESRLTLNKVQREGLDQQLKLLRDVEGTTAKLPQTGSDYRLRLLDAQKNRHQAANESKRLAAEEEVISHELKQAKSEWQRFVEERSGELMEQEVQIRTELDKIIEEIHKAERLHELVSLRAPQDGIVLHVAERSVGSIIQQAEPLITLVPANSTIEVEVNVQPKDIARIRTGDSVRVKLDAFPFQRHDTLPGEVRVISEDSFEFRGQQEIKDAEGAESSPSAFYRARVRLLSNELRNVPDGFRLMPGMRVRAEIKVGTRSVISYFLYPIIRAFDESLREP
ncbi:HlyD family type I secretion periplasmic adaptor subunit [Desulfopila sp. IMCC35008]|uniref:HlyD family type I secretion periplasmic adaptor subunit n=1 Tax=Desulfopila sp. IMCC35008 TaxID=2653858 RepID=UPI0013D13596|nr:HlyD family type I secretion periplasmic adaptor subunit [Desulfopila sp. IMCC35008]